MSRTTGANLQRSGAEPWRFARGEVVVTRAEGGRGGEGGRKERPHESCDNRPQPQLVPPVNDHA